MTPPPEYLLEKARHYCAYQERSIFDVKQKLQQWKASETAIQEIIKTLKAENYINEERFVKAFAIGKLRHNKWGRNKIIQALKQKQIPDLYIQIGLGEIDEEEYLNTLKAVLSNKTVKANDEFTRKNKLIRYAVQKGFQPELARKILDENDF
ncbi:RecX family transcriptional regulator [Candidatus Sulfidibacterium hydrothermale]|uniref:regulatory protein RecX n=1 Tax=Candidatus Sulfidibacterium hydrothermale TaxID=2875962 RepID=UPI001F0A4552|nr:regulatory protein RecX [Candidatus Sulfidibacterium hydrothermale]UBM63501.1 RecX family transcriptional regulator [Candidatus Sulfidibacterium hydrothermale]